MLEVLGNALEQLISDDLQGLSESELHDLVVSLRHKGDLLAAVEAKAVAVWDSKRIWSDDSSRSAAHRLARESGCSIKTGKALVRRARRLSSMPATTKAFTDGDLSTDRVDLLTRLNKPNVAALFARDEEMLVEQIGSLSFDKAARLGEYWSQHADEGAAKSRAERLLDQRSANVSKTFEGSVDLRALFDPVNGEIFFTEFERLEDELFEMDWAEAKLRVGDNVCASDLARTGSQRRADALVEMAKRSASMPTGAKAPRPLITIITGDESFAKVLETGEGTVLTPGCILPLLGNADIERVVFDGPSRVIDVSHKRGFTGALRRALEVRDRHCQDPSGCDVPARRCEGDHIQPWSLDFPTEQSNGQCLCAFHNRLKGADPPAAA